MPNASIMLRFLNSKFKVQVIGAHMPRKSRGVSFSYYSVKDNNPNGQNFLTASSTFLDLSLALHPAKKKKKISISSLLKIFSKKNQQFLKPKQRWWSPRRRTRNAGDRDLKRTRKGWRSSTSTSLLKL